MQALWSRAAQAQACSCRSCLHAANSLTGRSATAAPRRKVSLSDVFTACYTTIMATAAVADASYKDRRREDLDRRIDEAKAGLSRVAEQSSADGLTRASKPVLHPWNVIPDASPSAVEALSSICISKEELLRHPKSMERRERHLEYLYGTFFLAHKWNKRKREPLDGANLELLDRAIMEEEEQLEITQREPRTQTQFTRATDMISDLVDQLLAEAHRAGLPNPDDTTALRASMDNLDSPWTMVRLLKSEGYPQYDHPDFDSDATLEARRHVNRASRNIFADWAYDRNWRNWNKGKIKTMVAKLCYNLLVSPVPPGIHNFNALISGFTRLGEHNLARVVVDTFLHSSRLRPTQQTLVCLLHHYRAKGDILGFYTLVRRLIGQDDRGVRIRRISHEVVGRYRSLRVWAEDSDVVISKEYFVERAKRDGSLLDALMRGLLSFGQVQHAAKVLVMCLKEGLPVDVQIFLKLISDIITNVDPKAAGTVIRGLLHNVDDATSLILGDDCPRRLVQKIHSLFSLCRMEVPAKTLPWGLPVGTGDLQSFRLLTTAMWIRETASHLSRLASMIRRMSMKLSKGVPLRDVASMGLNELSLYERWQASHLRDMRNYQRMARLQNLQAEYEALCKQITISQLQLLDIVKRYFPSLKQAKLRLQHIPIEDRWPWYWRLLLSDPLARQAHDALYVGAKLRNEASSALLQAVPADESRRLREEYGSLSAIPLDAVAEARARYAGPLADEDLEATDEVVEARHDSPASYSFTANATRVDLETRVRRPFGGLPSTVLCPG